MSEKYRQEIYQLDMFPSHVTEYEHDSGYTLKAVMNLKVFRLKLLTDMNKQDVISVMIMSVNLQIFQPDLLVLLTDGLLY